MGNLQDMLRESEYAADLELEEEYYRLLEQHPALIDDEDYLPLPEEGHIMDALGAISKEDSPQLGGDLDLWPKEPSEPEVKKEEVNIMDAGRGLIR